MKFQIEAKTISLVFEDIKSTNVESLMAELSVFMIHPQFKESQIERFEFDFLKTKMIDSSGLNFVLNMIKELKNKYTLSAKIGSPLVMKLFHQVKLDQLMECSFEEAKR
ncbi:MAG: hypothetical protein V4507_14215 [Verrucomicrobiota bacterium]